MKKQRFFPIAPLALALVLAVVLFIQQRKSQTSPAESKRANPASATEQVASVEGRGPVAQPASQPPVAEAALATNAVVTSPMGMEKVVSIESGAQDQVVRVPAGKELAK